MSFENLTDEGLKHRLAEDARKIRLHETILRTAGEGIYGIDEQARTTFVNPAAAKLLGKDESALIGKTIYETLFGAHTSRIGEFAASPIAFALDEGETVHISEETFYRSDGSTFLVEYLCAPIIENDKVTGAVLTFQDITERRDVQGAVAEARDRALENARLKTAFVANISHEIRTPLNGIVGVSQLLAGTPLNVEQREYLELVIQSAKNLSAVVNDVLDFSKIESGKLKPEKIPFNVKDLTLQVVNLFTVEAERKDVRVSFTENLFSSGECLGDAFRLRQILNNLVGNAVKFTSSGGRVDVLLKESEPKRKDESSYYFEIKDSGIGIAPEVLKTLFQPFTQADVSTSRNFGGTGLGLAISKDLVTLLGGEIGAESAPNSGSRFWFKLNFAKDLSLTEENFPPPESHSSQAVTEKLPRVLIVEDNEINLRVTCAIVREIGGECFFAKNGAEALQMVVKQEFDIVLTDCQMPVLDGYETARQIRLLKRQKERYLPIIALTAHLSETEKEKCLAVGMDDYLSKPFTSADLKAVFQKHLPPFDSLHSLDENNPIGQHLLTDIIEAKVLRQLAEIENSGEPDFVRHLLENYLQYAATTLDTLKIAWRENDAAQVERAAHQLRGSSASIGLESLQKIFEIVENEARDETLSNVGANIERAEAELEQIKSKLQNLSETSTL